MSEYIVIERQQLRQLFNEAFHHGWDRDEHCTFLQLLEMAIAPAASLPTGWRPIADAPKDGTWVLVAAKAATRTGWLVLICNWRDDNWREPDTMRFAGGHIEPTHFLPLIEPTEK